MVRFYRTFNFAFLFVLLFTCFINPLAASDSLQKRPLTHHDYDSWKSIESPKISTDGRWILYLETPQDGDVYLIAKNVEDDREYRYGVGYSGEDVNAERAARPEFTYDTRHILFLISPTKAESDTAKPSKKDAKKDNGDKTKKKLGILNLKDGSVVVIDSVKSYSLPEEAAGWVAYLKEEPAKKEKKKDEQEEEAEKKTEEVKKEKTKAEEEKEKWDKEKADTKKYGTRLVVQQLGDTTMTRIESVLDCRFTKNGTYLLYIVSSKDKPETDGLYSLMPLQSRITPLLIGKGDYKKWSMNKQETRLALVTDRDDREAKEPTFALYGWNVDSNSAELWVSHTCIKNFPDSIAVSDKSDITFSEDGSVVLFGIKEMPKAKDDDEDDAKKREPKKARFELWHWNDPYPQPQQKKRAKQVRDNTWESLYFVDKKQFVKLADEKLPDAHVARDGRIAWAMDPWPYAKRVSYFGAFNELYVIDPRTGDRTLVKQEHYGSAALSPNSNYLYWFVDKAWYVYSIKNRVITNITGSLGVQFDVEDWDMPGPPNNYGIAGWTNNDESILVYDRYDIWEISPDGKRARMITEGFGRANNISLRYVRLDPEEQTIHPGHDMLLQATHEKTMASGFYVDRVQGEAAPRQHVMMDRNFAPRVTKAKNANRLLYSRSGFDEFPDLWVSDVQFSALKKLTDLGKQMEPFIWGKAELRDFTSSDGKPLKGILIKPENFDASKKYPLMVYIYETLHSGLHRFRDPSPGTSINPSVYASNGYILWMPDIEYGTGYPGKDALKCVLPGIQMLVSEGYIDEKAIGIQGHSWGGYQIAYMITQTNVFAAVEAGAPVCNMTSAYDGIRWGTGMVRQFQYEVSQSRLGASLWDVPMRYIDNSPIFWADKVETPILMIHNDADGAVPWYQGIEYIMALRRLGKEAYMFNYTGEDHGLDKRVNQMDWTIRMAEYFDHFLKYAPAPKWMKDGIKAWEHEEEEKQK